MTNIKRIAVSTGGGDCSGLNAAIRAIVLRAEASGIEVLGVEDGLVGAIAGTGRGIWPLKSKDVNAILERGGTIIGTTNRGNPFAYPGPRGEPEDRSQEIIRRLRELQVDCLISIGGDGTQKIALDLDRMGFPVIGVPKTIDNDLDATYETFGFGTAVQVATNALDRLRTTAESHERIMLLEVMGRHAGWIALHAGIAGGADAILLPEIPYDPQCVVECMRKRMASGHHFALIVVAEGAAPKGGEESEQQVAGTKKGRQTKVLGGAAHRVAQVLSEHLPESEFRVTVLGHIQRGGTPIAYDRLLATRLGVEAVEAAIRGEHRVLISSQPPNICTVPLEQAAAQIRQVDPNSQLVAHARGVGICLGD